MNKTLVYNAKDSDVIMAMYNLLGCSNKYLNKSGTLWRYYRDQTPLKDSNFTDVIATENENQIYSTYPMSIFLNKLLEVTASIFKFRPLTL